MPKLVTTEEAIFHLHEEDSADPSLYIDAAEAAVTEFLNRNVYPDQQSLDDAIDSGGIDSGDTVPIVVTPAIKAAVLLILGNLWRNRGDEARPGGADVLVDSGAQSLLLPYRVGFGG